MPPPPMTVLNFAAQVFRDFAIYGVPVSGPHEPVKSEIRALFAQLVALIGSEDIPTELAADIAAIAGQIETVQTNADLTQLAKTAAVAASAAAITARIAAEAARDEALAYAELTGPFLYYPTKAAANAALGGLPADQMVQVWADETEDGARTVYKKTGGVLVLQTTLQYVTPTSPDILSNKTFSGAAPFLLDGGRMLITGADALPADEPSVAQIQNDGVSNVALRVNSMWEGATGADYTNNDCTLFVVHSKVISDSANRSWAASLSNAYRDIPEGVTDAGEAVGVIGWAASVAIPGYQHAGVLAAQCGVRGRAGFQAAGSAETAVVQEAVGVDGSVVNESEGATIQNAIAVRAIVDDPVGNLQNSTAIYAKAAPGTNNTYSFYGAAGTMYNKDPIETISYIKGLEYLLGGSVFADRDDLTNRLWTPGGDVAVQFGPELAMIRRGETQIASADANVVFARFNADGGEIRMGEFVDNAAAVAGGVLEGKLYHTPDGAVRVVV